MIDILSKTFYIIIRLEKIANTFYTIFKREFIMINRDDMLELTRRMTPARSCFDRIAGAYIDDIGEVDESFNIHFGKLTTSDKAKIWNWLRLFLFLKPMCS